jgi:hypothetical protein
LTGLFGLLTTIGLLIGFAYIDVGETWGYGPEHTLEDPIDGFVQV